MLFVAAAFVAFLSVLDAVEEQPLLEVVVPMED
jgi:hypothetical protein